MFCLSILFTCTICFCLIYFNLGNVSSCIDIYLGIFVNRIEIEVELVPGQGAAGTSASSALVERGRSTNVLFVK